MPIDYQSLIHDKQLLTTLKRLRVGDKVHLSEEWAQKKSSYRRTDCLLLCSLFLANVLHKGSEDLYERVSALFDSSFFCTNTPLLLEYVGEQVKATYCMRMSWDEGLYAPFFCDKGTYMLIRIANANTTHFVTVVSNGVTSLFFDPYSGLVSKGGYDHMHKLSLGVKLNDLLNVESSMGLKTDRIDICKFKSSYARTRVLG